MEYKERVRQYSVAARDLMGSAAGLSESLFERGIKRANGEPIADTTIGNWCSGATQPSPHVLIAICDATGLSLDLLAGLYGPPRVGSEDEVRLALGARFDAIETQLEGLKRDLRGRRPA